MSRKMTKYTTEFKTKIVLEVLKGENTLNEIASKYNIIPKNIMNWKKIFMDNAELAMEPAKLANSGFIKWKVSLKSNQRVQRWKCKTTI